MNSLSVYDSFPSLNPFTAGILLRWNEIANKPYKSSMSRYKQRLRNVIQGFFLIVLGCAAPSLAQNSAFQVSPTWLWGTAQLVPSPQWVTSNPGLRFGLRWQVTPVLYSFGLNHRVSRWRFLVAEPLARQNGSLEFFISPEYLDLGHSAKDHWLVRGGLRAYFPIYRYGEYVSASLSPAVYSYQGRQGISYEAGIYFFFGILGFQTTYSPALDAGRWIFTIRLRYF